MPHQFDRVMTNGFGPATLLRLYRHRDTKEEVWEVATDEGERMHLSQKYVARLPLVVERGSLFA